MRYKEYNKNRVLEKCIDLFWDRGFGGCSVNDIVEATGVNRFSLYQEFENKEGILYNALKLYRERYSFSKFELLKKEGQLEHVLEAFYLSFLDNKTQNQGCFFIHIGTELADNDPKIKELIKEYLSHLEDLMVNRLKNSDYAGENVVMYARHLIGLFCTSMSFCLIHSDDQKRQHIRNGITVILNKKLSHATST